MYDRPAPQAGSATRAAGELKRQLALARRHLRALTRAAAALASDLDRAPQTVVEALVVDFDAALARLWLYDPATGTLNLRASAGPPAKGPESSQEAVEAAILRHGRVAEVARSRTPFVKTGLTGEPRLDQASARLEGIDAVAAFPLLVAGELRGVLAGCFRQPPLDETVDVLASIAAMAATSLDDAQRLVRERAARAEAEAAERRFRGLVEGLDAIIWEVDAATWRYSFVSQRAEAILGYPVEQWYREPGFWARIIHPDDREPAEALSRRAPSEGPAPEFEYRAVTADGRVVWLRDIVRVALDEEGRARQLRGVTVDITEQKRAERRLRFLAEASRQLAASLDYEATLDALAWLAVPELADYCIVDVVEADQSIRRLAVSHGDRADPALARELQRHPPDPTRTEGAPRALRTGQSVLATEVPDAALVAAARSPEHLAALRAVGMRSYMSVPLIARERTLGVLTFLSAGSGRRYGPEDLRLVEDLARRAAVAIDNARLYREAQAAHSEAEAAHRWAAFLAEASRQLAASLDYEATLTRVAELTVPEIADWCFVDLAEGDRATRRLALVHSEPEKEALAREFRHASFALDGPHPVARVIRTGRPELVAEVTDAYLSSIALSAEHLEQLRRLDPASYIFAPLNARGRTLGTLSFLSSGSGRRYGPADLALAEGLARRAAVAIDNARLYAEAQEAIRVRDDFLARASHELRTPLTVVKGHLGLVTKRASGTDAGTLDLLTVAHRHVDQMTRLITGLLEASRLASGSMPLEAEPLELTAVVAEGLAQADPMAREKGVGLVNALPPGLSVMGDRLRLEQVVLNLLINAIKHTPPGGTVRVEGEAVEGEVDLRVRDSGEGISPEHLERIFEPFFQVGSATGRRKAAGQGAGLGLAIARRLIELHGGRIWAESEGRGRGSTFRVRLPAMPGRGRAG